MEDYSDGDDSEEEFRFDVATRCVMPSYYQQVYSSQSMAAGAQDDDDGWDSSDESCMPVIPAPDQGIKRMLSTHCRQLENRL